MGKQIQRLVDIGLSIEATRATAEAAPDFWIPKMDLDFIPKVDLAVDNSGLGVIDSRRDSAVVQEYGEGSIGGIVYDESFGVLLALALGTWSSSVASDNAYTHAFTRLNTNAHPSATIFVKDENLDERYGLAMLSQLTINAVVDDYVKFTAGFLSKAGAATSSTPAYTSENAFLPSHMAVKLAANVGSLAGANETALRSLSLTINKNPETWPELGSIVPADIVNKEFSIEGEMELVYDDSTERDFVLEGTDKAMSIILTNEDVTIGTATNPSLSFEIARASLVDFGRGGGAGDIETQTIRFEGNFDLTEAKTISASLVNEHPFYISHEQLDLTDEMSISESMSTPVEG